MQTIHSPELFLLDGFRKGGSQEWYSTRIQRLSGCGPTNGSHLVWYLARSRQTCAKLYPDSTATSDNFLALMKQVWRYITPGFRGVNTTERFVEGIERFGAHRNLPLQCRVLNVPKDHNERPSWKQMVDFVVECLADDLPVAFLNLHNGDQRNLDSWHWVVLVGLDADTSQAQLYDQGYQIEINLRRWLETTKLGGGFVAAEPR